MERSRPVDGFRLAYERAGSGPPVVLLHGWPGDRTDHAAVIPLLTADFEVVVPDLRGFGESDKHPEPPAAAYSAAAQARSVLGLIEELRLERPLLAGYDVGSRIAQTIARDTRERVRALVVSPPLPGAGRRVLSPDAMREFWYQSFHQLSLIEELLDGDRAAVRAYLAHFSAPLVGPCVRAGRRAARPPRGRLQPAGRDDRLSRLVPGPRRHGGLGAGGDRARRADRHARHRAVAGARPALPARWSDRLDVFFSDVEVVELDGVGHFTPVEAPEAFAAAIRARAG